MPKVEKIIRLATVAKELNVGSGTLIGHLQSKGFNIESKPTAKLTEEMHALLLKTFSQEKADKEAASQIRLGTLKREDVEIKESEKIKTGKKIKQQEEVLIKNIGASDIDLKKATEYEKLEGTTVVGKVDLSTLGPKPKQTSKTKEKKEEKAKEPEVIKGVGEKLSGPTVVGKIDLPDKRKDESKKKLVASSSSAVLAEKKKRRRKRIVKAGRVNVENEVTTLKKTKYKGKYKKRAVVKEQISEKEIEEQIKTTLSKLEGPKAKSERAKYKRLKRESAKEAATQEQTDDKNIVQLTEFISVSELAGLLDVAYTDIIQACMKLGIIVSINQRLDAETIEIVADEFGYDVEFIKLEQQQEEVAESEDEPEDLVERQPIVTVMGHVDHGKTSLLDYIRKTNVTEKESGGITQHIGAYEVNLEKDKKITFLDTPGHEAFTAMRARGAQVTDIAVIVIAADDGVMPQTKEAISHAQAAGVPMIFAINKIDKQGANPDKIKEALSKMNLLVEEWGGKYQSQDIAAKKGLNIDQLLEKILLEAELLELKANPDRNAEGVVLEATLDKGKGHVTSFLVEKGTMQVGDIVLAGSYYGKVKAMFNEKGEATLKTGPAQPVQILGLDGAPQAGERFKVMDSEQEVKQIANKRQQILREQGIRAQKHITLEEIGRRLALGTFKELNVIVKADVDGSVEALVDSLQKLSVEEIQVNIIHKSVGQISESDVLLASASDAIIVGFQVRPSLSARKLAEKIVIDIRLYSVIYDAIEEIKSAMEGMLEPKVEEKVVCNIEIREVFKISKVGTVAGCYVQDGKVTRDIKIHLLRDGIVLFTGELDSLKRFKEDVKEVSVNMECGLTIKNFNDIKVDDVIEGYKEIETKRTL